MIDKSTFLNTTEETMSIQFLLVNYSEDRTVLADGQSVGVTNHTIMLPSDEYTISLAGAKDYSPDSQDVALTGTSVMKPRVVLFSKL